MDYRSPKSLTSRVQGFYKIEATNAETGRTRLVADWFPNVITNGGLNRMGTADYLDFCSVGSGTATPQFTDTALQAIVASTSSVTLNNRTTSSAAPYYGSLVRRWRFTPGQAVGNLSEVGVGWAAASLFSRALILDNLGAPTTITILSNEYLDITYELRNYAPVDDDMYTIYLGTTPINCTVRAAYVTDYTTWAPDGGVIKNYSSPSIYLLSGAIGAVTTGPSGTSASGTLASNAYVNNSYTKTFYGIWALDSANFGSGGIQSFRFATTAGYFQIGFSPAIPKDNTKTFRLDFGVSWARKV